MLTADFIAILYDLAVAADAVGRDGQRRSRLRYQGPATGPATRPVPMICAPAEDSSLRSQHSCRLSGAPGHTKSRPQVYRSYTLRSPASTWILQAARTPARRRRPQRAAPPAERQTRTPCRHVPAAWPGRATRRQPPWPWTNVPPAPRVLPDIHPPRHRPGSRSDACPRRPPDTLGNRQPPAPASRTSARLSAACEAGMATPANLVRGRPWKADGYTDRATGPDAVRHMSVDTATHRPIVTHPDTRRDKKETARLAENSQLAGRFRRWWQVLG